MSKIQLELDERISVNINGIPCEIKFHDSKTGIYDCEINWAQIEHLHKTFVALKKMEVECRNERNSKKRK